MKRNQFIFSSSQKVFVEGGVAFQVSYSSGVFCRNFPQGCISDMVSDVSRGIGHVCENIIGFGGDPDM